MAEVEAPKGEAVRPPHWPQTECAGMPVAEPSVAQHRLSNQRTYVLSCSETLPELLMELPFPPRRKEYGEQGRRR